MTDDGLPQLATAEIQQTIKGSHDATARLLAALEVLRDLDVTRPSLLPDWTVGHVLTHLARNADSFVRILAQQAKTGRCPSTQVVPPGGNRTSSKEPGGRPR